MTGKAAQGRRRVVCAMSGGVDSSVAAALMVEAGHQVIGMTLSLYDVSASPRKGRGGSCCSPAEVDLAKRVCTKLGIPHYTVDEERRFGEAVIDDFVREYAAGRTPNPCARCNEHVKFTPLVQRARALGAEALVTGHYAQVRDGALWRGEDPAKDQSYFLFAMGLEHLGYVEFPLGAWTKDDVRARARHLSMPNADTPDSQELCFVPGGDHGDVVEARARKLGLDPALLGAGDIHDTQGNVLGRHRGIHRVTIGQRRGLGISSASPVYVLRVLPQERVVVVGALEALERRILELRDVRWLIPDVRHERGDVIRASVQIRHRAPARAATVRLDTGEPDAGEPDTVRVEFDAPVQAVAPGQAAVIYDGDQVIGGGWIV